MKKDEYKFVFLIAVGILFLTSLPYLYASLSSPPEKQFMGFILNVSDHAQYLSWYKSFQTNFLISNRLTSEPNAQIFFNLLWWVLGRIGYYSELDYRLVFQIFRWFSGIFFLSMVYLFVSLVYPSIIKRQIIFLVISLGSGLGWVLVFLKYTITRGELLYPLDIYIAEGNSFLSILAYPHFAEAAGFILAIFWLLIRGVDTGRIWYAIVAGIVALLLGFQHTYDLVIVWGIPATYILAKYIIERKFQLMWIKSLAIVVIISFLPALYSVLLTNIDPLWNQILEQFSNAGVYSPTPPHMFIFMGIPLVLALGAILLRIRDRILKISINQINLEEFIIVWFFSGWLLIYIPTDFQIHMLNSLQVPIGLLASICIFEYIYPFILKLFNPKINLWIVSLVIILFILPTNIYLFVWRFIDLARYDYPYYLYRDEVAALNWLESNAEENSVILSHYQVGQFIPGISGHRSFLGHWAQTVSYYEKQDTVEALLNPELDNINKFKILSENQIDYIVWGSIEKDLSEFSLHESTYLKKVFESKYADVFEVDLENSKN